MVSNMLDEMHIRKKFFDGKSFVDGVDLGEEYSDNQDKGLQEAAEVLIFMVNAIKDNKYPWHIFSLTDYLNLRI